MDTVYDTRAIIKKWCCVVACGRMFQLSDFISVEVRLLFFLYLKHVPGCMCVVISSLKT